jgi:HNH endonuclease
LTELLEGPLFGPVTRHPEVAFTGDGNLDFVSRFEIESFDNHSGKTHCQISESTANSAQPSCARLMISHAAGDRRYASRATIRPSNRVSAEETMSATKSYNEIVDFIAAGTTPEAVVAFRPSDGVQQRVAELVERSKSGRVSTRNLASDINESQRRSVQNAAHRCEYCLIHEDDSYSPHQIDHIVSRKHSRLSELNNLAYACLRCNVWKGATSVPLIPKPACS